MTSLNTQPISQDILAEKYLAAGELMAEQLFRRVSQALADLEKPELRAEWAERLFENMKAGAIGARRIMSDAGLGLLYYFDKPDNYFDCVTRSFIPHLKMMDKYMRMSFLKKIDNSCASECIIARTGFFSSFKEDKKNLP